MRELDIEMINPPFGISAERHHDLVRLILKTRLGEQLSANLSKEAASDLATSLQALVKGFE
ncbi:hypothetical protein NKH54_12370 [Mesorhizobium sp. M1004]|uniref:hypothetical protein n=1 Tax=Mesorhizobium sp. M1004 TaxID=2957046 RepID=UPI00333D9AFA